MELYEEDRLIVYVHGLNSCQFSDISLPKSENNYYLKAYFDMREWPDCKILSDETKDIAWILRI